MAPGVLIMARAPRRGEVRRALEPVLGLDGCLALQTALITQALDWAAEVAPGRIHVAYEPADAGPDIRALISDDVLLFPQNGDGIGGRLADAIGRVFARGGGPLLVVWPNIPRLSPDHATGALSDLEAGADIVLGPAIDGGLYLVAIQRPLAALFSLPERAWRAADAVAIAAGAAQEAGLEIGILRAERPLQRPADVRAFLADPMLPEMVGQILRRYGATATDSR
jgi:glycosyltransferase A (GT-A) superfamily protein (DUF2064 family)